MAYFEPLFNDVKIITSDTGRYRVQLEIPGCSTLSENDIDRILKISSWEHNPNKSVDGYEGGRSAVLTRENSIEKGGIRLGALQLSGIGYKEIEIKGDIGMTDDDSEFFPPNNTNFMDFFSGTTKMSTSYAEGNKFVVTRPDYRPMGTYTFPELKTTLDNTIAISGLDMENMVVPHVEAYGRYLDDILVNDDGPFGFLVLPIPGVEDQRFALDFENNYSEIILGAGKVKSITPVDAVEVYYNMIMPSIAKLVIGLRELHGKGYAHLQPHFSNFYIADDQLYLMDWSTLKRFGENEDENVLNRSIDLIRPSSDYNNIFSAFFSSDIKEFETFKLSMDLHIKELVLEIYSDKLSGEINMHSLYGKVRRALGRAPSDIETIVYWLKDSGFGGENSSKPKKIGRNEPCPCDSGLKYKKCCGRKMLAK